MYLFKLVLFPKFHGFVNTNTMFTWAVSVFSSLHRLSLQLVTLIASWDSLSIMALQFLENIVKVKPSLLYLQHYKFFSVVDQELQIFWASRVYFLVSLINDRTSRYDPWISCTLLLMPLVFLAVQNFDISIWLVPDELLGLLFDDLWLYERSDGGHDAK